MDYWTLYITSTASGIAIGLKKFSGQTVMQDKMPARFHRKRENFEIAACVYTSEAECNLRSYYY